MNLLKMDLNKMMGGKPVYYCSWWWRGVLPYLQLVGSSSTTICIRIHTSIKIVHPCRWGWLTIPTCLPTQTDIFRPYPQLPCIPHNLVNPGCDTTTMYTKRPISTRLVKYLDFLTKGCARLSARPVANSNNGRVLLPIAPVIASCLSPKRFTLLSPPSYHNHFPPRVDKQHAIPVAADAGSRVDTIGFFPQETVVGPPFGLGHPVLTIAPMSRLFCRCW